MDSIVLYTEEIDDLEEAAEELFSQMEGFSLKKNSMAILYTEEDTEYGELYDILKEKWDFPVIGCTAMAVLQGKEGYCQIGISVMILTADDCTFTAGITDEINLTNYKSEIPSKYEELKKPHEEDINLVISYGGMVTNDTHVAGDELVATLGEVSGGVPVYGASASDGLSFNGFKVFYNDVVTTNGQAIALISGNIDPKFVVINSIENRASFSYEITKSDSNTIQRLGTGTFLGEVPEGAILNIGIINRDDVQKSVNEAFDRTFKYLEEADGKYKTLLCNSCAARFLALASNTSAEAKTYQGRLPEDVSLLGIYAYGEYCPVAGNVTKKEYNMFHNFTFTIMIL